MGNMIANLAAMSAFMGFSSALDTLQSQAAGSGNLELCGVYLHRARVVMCMLFVPILTLLLNCKPLLLALGQDATVTGFCYQYILAYLPGLFMAGLADIQRKFLNNFGKNKVSLYSGAIGAVIHVGNCWLFLVHFELGITGLGIAVSMTQSAIFFALLLFTHMQEDLNDALIPFDRRAFQDLKQYFGLAIPGYVMFALDSWVWEFMVLISGIIGVKEQAATIILMNMVSCTY